MLEKALALVHLDFAPNHRQPSGGLVLLATVVSIAGSLLADALIVVLAQALIPSTKGYVHFQFSDYAKLTVIGVIIACVAWPITTRITSQPRWMFFRMAAGVTLVLWLPDVYILMKGQPAKAVAFLFVMHVAIALVTYNALVHLAPVRALAHPSHRRPQPVRQ
jgi:bacteriorhodopsin